MPNQGAPGMDNALRIGTRLPWALKVALAPAAQAFCVHVRPVMPAALALGVGAWFDVHLGRTFRAVRSCPRCNEYIPQLSAEPRNGVVDRAGRAQVELGGERGADLLLLAPFLDCLRDRLAQLADGGPTVERGLVQLRVGHFVPGVLKDAELALPPEHLPRLLGGKAQDRRHQAHEAMGDVEKRGLRRAARARVGAARVKPVLEDIEVEAAQVLRAE